MSDDLKFQQIEFKITNRESGEIRFFIEPWGDEFGFPSETTFLISAKFPADTNWIPEVVYYRNEIIAFHMYDGEGAFFELHSDGLLLRSIKDYHYP